MSAPPDPGSIVYLTDEGFVGFRTVGQLHADGCEEIPNVRGIYAIVRDTLEPPQFLPNSTAARVRDTDPTLPIEQLERRWVPGAQILGFGLARGPGVRSLLKQQVKRYLRFGYGRVVVHAGGRALWQLGDRSTLRVAWKPMPDDDPEGVVRGYREQFEQRHGAPPFNDAVQENDD